jgi:hypothetical protein
MTGGQGTNRVLIGAALAGIVAAGGVVGLLLSAKMPGRTPSPSAGPLPTITSPSVIDLGGCFGISTQAPSEVTATPAAPVPAQPVSSYGYNAVDDPATRQVVLFGGIDDYADTWLWDGERWILAHPSASPPGRFGAAGAYDPVSREVMIYGGRLADGTVVCDTWAWTGSNWVELDKGDDQLPPGEGAWMAWDANRQEMVLVTNTGTALETWVWEGGWVRQPDGDLAAGDTGGLGFDPASGSLLLLADGSTWTWDGSTWRRALGSPPPSTGWMAIDPASHHPVLLAYFSPTQSAPALWAWSSARWGLVPGSSIPSVDVSEIVTDDDRGLVLLFGSLMPSTQQAPQPLHVWAWTRGGWHQLE